MGRRFAGNPLAAVDGLKGYIASVGDSVYYGDCVQSKGIFGGGSCQLPLQVTTVIYHLHSNKALGPQHNIVVRGVPATVYDEGRSIELYIGRVAIDIFSDTFAHALAAAQRLLPRQRARIRAPATSPRRCTARGCGEPRTHARTRDGVAPPRRLPARRGDGSVHEGGERRVSRGAAAARSAHPAQAARLPAPRAP